MKTFFWTKQNFSSVKVCLVFPRRRFDFSFVCAFSSEKTALFRLLSLCFSRSPQKAKSVFCVLTRRLFDSALFRVLFLKWKNVCSFSKWRDIFLKEAKLLLCQSLSVCVFPRRLFDICSFVCSFVSGEKTLPLFFFDFCSRVCDKIKLLSPLKKKPKKSKRTLLFFFTSFSVLLFFREETLCSEAVFARFPPLLRLWTLSLLFFFDSCN